MLNLALPQYKQLKIQNKLQLHKYKYKLTYCDIVLLNNTLPQVHWVRTRHLAGPS